MIRPKGLNDLSRLLFRLRKAEGGGGDWWRDIQGAWWEMVADKVKQRTNPANLGAFMVQGSEKQSETNIQEPGTRRSSA